MQNQVKFNELAYLHKEGDHIVKTIQMMMRPGHGLRTGTWQRSVFYILVPGEEHEDLDIGWTAPYGIYPDRHYDYEFSKKIEDMATSTEFEYGLLNAIDLDVQQELDEILKNNY